MLVEASGSDDDRLLAEVDRFARRAIEPRTARPEAPADEAAFGAILAEADALGLAADASAASGLAPWDELDRALPPARTLAVLVRLARANTSVALAVHARALARALLRRGEVHPAPARPTLALQVRLGLGRGALAAVLASAELGDDDRAMLADVYAPGAARVLPLDPSMDALVTLAFDGRGLGFQLHDRAALAIAVDAHPHGLDELSTATVSPRAEARLRLPVSAGDVASAIAADQLALVAVALGAVERAHGLARAFAAQRRQGGRVIDRHDAVQLLLARSRATIESVLGALEGCAARPLSPSRFGAALGVRATSMPALAGAAHAAMQVFGGLGYMRETGVERVARDVNALRAMAGAPGELALVLAAWERLHE